MNVKPILDLIMQEAGQTADKLIAEAEDRASTILEESRLRLSRMADESLKLGRKDGQDLVDRIHRLGALEERKELLQSKRALISQAFEQALSGLRALPAEEAGRIFLDLIIKNAKGTETLAIGEINPAFFDEGFLARANRKLEESGKPGKLAVGTRRVPGVCGLVLEGAHSQTECTFESLMDSKRDGMESLVAGLLFNNHPA